MHNAAFAACGLDWVYVAFEVPGRRRPAPRSMPPGCSGLAGLSVTMPHKTDVAGLVDDALATVEALRAANTVVVRRRATTAGESTDGDGFVDSLRLDHDVEPRGLAVVVLGAGGAARAVVLALAEAGCREVVVVNRTAETAPRRRPRSAPALGRVGRPVDVRRRRPGGARHAARAWGCPADLPIDPVAAPAGQVVVDLVYHPRRTPLLAAAAERGCRTVDGLGMLVHQGARQFTLWTGVEAPRAVMRAAAETALARP